VNMYVYLSMCRDKYVHKTLSSHTDFWLYIFTQTVGFEATIPQRKQQLVCLTHCRKQKFWKYNPFNFGYDLELMSIENHYTFWYIKYIIIYSWEALFSCLSFVIIFHMAITFGDISLLTVSCTLHMAYEQ